MSFLDQITVLILTSNEEANIGRTLSALKAFDEVVVLDSGSTDATLSMAGRFANVRCVTNPFASHQAQWTFGVTSCGIERPWILALDADFVLQPKTVDELAALRPSESDAGFSAAFQYCIYGRALSGSLYPRRVVLFRRDRATFCQNGHTQRLTVRGETRHLEGKIFHDDRKSLSRWISSQLSYAKLEAEYLLAKPNELLRVTDRIRKGGIFSPILVFFYTLFVKRCIFDGWPGWFYATQRTFAEALISLEILDRRLRARSKTQ